MYRPEWDCTQAIDEMQDAVNTLDRTAEVCTLSPAEERLWLSLLIKITAWKNLTEGIDPCEAM